MLKVIDVGLMANHLSAHKGAIKRFELYSNLTKNPNLLTILGQQIGMMQNHVQVMNMLLDPNHTNQVTLQPVPQVTSQLNQNSVAIDIEIEDRDMAFDSHFTATSMANDNFISSTNMKNPQVKRIHSEMALQQSQIAKQYEMFAEQMGWMDHPIATSIQQQGAMSPLQNQTFNPLHQNGKQAQMNTQNSQRIQ
ncbi:hypothetical protein [Paenisporosarcina sp. TG20]|uniref:hypothetical protein n=1 Tax=Paenisporosarcina sp. TG20 TaxID=1211706 RepID=UPI00031D557C|nr:hypothetical protein [Paenisporosarcina sp. TG20]